MTTATALTERPPETRQPPKVGPQALPTGRTTMYAIAFDLDTDTLKKAYDNESYNNAYADIRRVLTTKHNFKWQQGSVYFGDPEKVNAVSCVLAIMDVSRAFEWFAPSVKDIRMLRIEEQNDLMGAVQQAVAE
jgi:virulence-associated protein VapD